VLKTGFIGAFAGASLLLLSACGGAAAPAGTSQSPSTPATASQAAPAASAAAKPSQAAASGSAAAKPSAGSPAASAAAKPGTKYKVGASAINSSLLPIELAADYGLYDKYGIGVEFNGTGVGNTTVAAMESGEIAAAYINPSNVAEAVAAGSGMRSVMSIGQRPSYLLVVTPDITKVEDLKGKNFAVANPGGQASVVAEVFLAQYGLKQGNGINLLNLGTEPTRTQAVQSGQVAGTIINPTFRDKIGNLKVLMDLRDQDMGLAGSSLAISSAVLKNQAASEALVKGTWEGIKLVMDPSQKSKMIDGLKKYLQVEGAAGEAAYQEMQKDFQGALPPKLDPTGVQKSMDILAQSNPQVKGLPVDKVIDNSIVDRLIQQGFK